MLERITRDEYDRMVARGMFEGERIELLRGRLVQMSPQLGPHANASAWLARYLIRRLPEARFDVRSHSPFAATDDSEPEPDVSVSPHGPHFNHPSRALLLIEVAISSLRRDRGIKTEIYAEAGVPEFWIVNLRDQVVEVLTDPTPRGYAKRQVLAAGDTLRPVKLPRIKLAVASIPWASRAELAEAQRQHRAKQKRIAARLEAEGRKKPSRTR